MNWILLATESVPAEVVVEVAEEFEGLESLDFGFQSGLLAMGVLLIVSIGSEKFGSKSVYLDQSFCSSWAFSPTLLVLASNTFHSRKFMLLL